MSFSDESSFVSALDRLTAFGGNDCPELAFNGIIDAIEIGKPAITSPMFVLTDAGVKPGEGPKYTLDNALGVVMNNLIPVNFFYSTESGSCGTFQRHEAFVELVDETEGFAMQFNSSGEIMKMSEAMTLALDGTTTILEGRSTTSRGRTLRSARDKTYTIPVDDTIETLLVTYIASNDPHRVELRNPARLPQPRTENLAQGGVWIIKRPTHGIWSLVFPANTGTHTVKVQSTSPFNLEFDYLFFDGQELGGEWHEYVAQYPLLGKITVALRLIEANLEDIYLNYPEKKKQKNKTKDIIGISLQASTPSGGFARRRASAAAERRRVRFLDTSNILYTVGLENVFSVLYASDIYFTINSVRIL